MLYLLVCDIDNNKETFWSNNKEDILKELNNYLNKRWSRINNIDYDFSYKCWLHSFYLNEDKSQIIKCIIDEIKEEEFEKDSEWYYYVKDYIISYFNKDKQFLNTKVVVK